MAIFRLIGLRWICPKLSSCCLVIFHINLILVLYLHLESFTHTHTDSFNNTVFHKLAPKLRLCDEHTHFLRHMFCIPSHKHTQLHPDSHSSKHTFSHLRNTDTHPHTFLHICTSSVDPNMLLRQATLQSLLPYPPLYPKGVYPSTVRTLYTQG